MIHSSLFHFIPILLFIIISSCKLEFTSPLIIIPDVPFEELVNAPDHVQINNQNFRFEASLNRDFFPPSPPDGRPLSAFIRLTEVDSSDIQPGVNASYIWVIYENEVWVTYLINENLYEKSYEQLRYAYDGPKWGPDVYADVITGITDLGGDLYLMKQEDVLIEKSW